MIGTTPNGVRVDVRLMTDESLEDDPERLDVREIDGEPFGDIMTALNSLAAGETLRLVNSFEPEPLYAVLESRGFRYETDEVDEGLWHVDIEHA